ncbi:MAG: hypothetical protein BJ554DRAFT_2774 [Olpidium bornovanus]|uniref:Uncharacterized protein n=1 Tax=Olpidium bornovanus TaxID=278681 RepID=A0A8H7ZPY5_9FUNG|nr:MAG: hypothetical protein BJ554DRAFT_2774 [Olpidium bornovanus]
MEQEVNTLKDLIATKKSEADREGRIKEKVEKELREVKAQVEFKSAEIKGQQATIQKNREEMTKLEATVKEQKQALDKAVKDQEKLATRAQKLQMDYEDQILSTTQLLSENQGQALELKIRDDELLKIREELRNINRVRDALGKKVKSIEEAKEQAESERESLKVRNRGGDGGGGEGGVGQGGGVREVGCWRRRVYELASPAPTPSLPPPSLRLQSLPFLT